MTSHTLLPGRLPARVPLFEPKELVNPRGLVGGCCDGGEPLIECRPGGPEAFGDNLLGVPLLHGYHGVDAARAFDVGDLLSGLCQFLVVSVEKFECARAVRQAADRVPRMAEDYAGPR